MEMQSFLSLELPSEICIIILATNEKMIKMQELELHCDII
jgi:hypothetical protein